MGTTDGLPHTRQPQLDETLGKRARLDDGGTMSCSSADQADLDIVTLQFLCTNDTHSQMEPFELEPYPHPIGGAARRAEVFAKMRAEVQATLTFDAGDLFTGTRFFDFFRGEAELTLLEKLGYHATAVGNHDFDGACPKSGENGMLHFSRVAAEHAPSVDVLCASVVDELTGKPLFHTSAVYEPAAGIKVGVASVLGGQAWDVTEASLRVGLRYTDFVKAAEAEAAALRAKGCDVLVCLSHTGVDRGDRELAALGLYDVVFSGHAHYFDQQDVFEQITGPGGSLGLLSKGFARGGGISWARLNFNRRSRRIVDHTCGLKLLDQLCIGDIAIDGLVRNWRSQFELAMGLTITFGQCADDVALPDRDREQLATFSPVHSALHRAVHIELLTRLREESALAESRLAEEESAAMLPKASDLVVVLSNRYSARTGLQAGTVTRGSLLDLIAYNSPTRLVQLSGLFLAAIIRRNALFAGCADFVYVSEVDYVLRCRDGSVPTGPVQREQVKAGVLECIDIKAFGEDVNVLNGWYWCVVDDYVLHTLLAGLPERVEGIRNTHPTGIGWRDLVEGHLTRGGVLQRVC